MSAAIVVLVIIGVLGWAAAIGVGIVAYRYGLLLLEIEDRIEQSLDELDDHYRHLGIILTLPLAADDVHARSVVAAIRKAHDSVLAVANVLAGGRMAAANLKGSGDDGE